eukprot:NODE_1855_length_713_cov_93.619454_g1805_i0.p1 GENE.NODE_1855_length_713_cov_93.619454_g1805_i0~~NODE_1855_length_713_cov_93.619454_g1805_i0.p1  ORF type:complete len:182 (+),score=3.84 NODE_1855_length_713_cov_93.619454_g1805_i0:67-612(+)
MLRVRPLQSLCSVHRTSLSIPRTCRWYTFPPNYDKREIVSSYSKAKRTAAGSVNPSRVWNKYTRRNTVYADLPAVARGIYMLMSQEDRPLCIDLITDELSNLYHWRSIHRSTVDYALHVFFELFERCPEKMETPYRPGERVWHFQLSDRVHEMDIKLTDSPQLAGKNICRVWRHDPGPSPP